MPPQPHCFAINNDLRGIMQILLTLLITWLVANSDLPASAELPQVMMVSAEKMAGVRHSRVGVPRADRVETGSGHAASDAGDGVYGIYDDLSRTIYLPENWTGKTPAEMSLLVHELVHHLQHVGKMRYDCAPAREGAAYKAQMQWLALFGKDLAGEFGLDPMTILVRTNCMR
jgi:hypothetical protein